jgi:hypothetical protein
MLQGAQEAVGVEWSEPLLKQRNALVQEYPDMALDTLRCLAHLEYQVQGL